MKDNQQNFVSTDLKIKKLQKDNEYLCKKIFELSSNIAELTVNVRNMKVYITALFIILIVLIVMVAIAL